MYDSLMYGDGALGGACMHKPYSDKPANTVLCWQPISGLKDVAKQIAASNFS
jgi:hypothetical protein